MALAAFEEYKMLKLKYPELEKPIFCAKEMSILEKWRDIRFHKRLWKTDERMLLLQAQIDGKEEVARNALAKDSTPEFVAEITGFSLEEIEKLQEQKTI